MKEFNFNEFNKKVKKRRPKITRTLLENDEIGRTKTRRRNKDEVNILNIITKSRWKKAMAQGKVKRVAKNTYDYFFD